ncbi:palmitoyltransferase ZDHHC20-B-like [Petromyzon marinus]|uniref:palmitoyltransferase ZDHHC20-B-like n=1 Tax=Petromyzon marinus TaxID=7757 RepID=UPI003F6F208E
MSLRGCSLLSWLPVVFICGVLAWAYYAYLLPLCVYTVTDTTEKVCYLISYHGSLAMLLWAFFQTVFTPLSRPSKEFSLCKAERQALEGDGGDDGGGAERGVDMQRELLRCSAHSLPLATCTESGAIRYCERCQLVKPDRCHHCSVCDSCVLKMDHHCPWVNNCVGYSNYKFFLLFLLYAALHCVLVTFTVLRYFLRFWTEGLADTQARFHILFLFLVAAMFSVSLLSLLGYHGWLLAINSTTLEAFRAPVFRGGDEAGDFSLGLVQNVRQVLGEDPRLWLLPIFTSVGDGQSFPTRRRDEATSRLLGPRHRHVGRTLAVPDDEEDDEEGEEHTVFVNPAACSSSSAVIFMQQEEP